MASFNEIHSQLMNSASQIKFVTVADVRLLSRIIAPTEQIIATVKGWYDRKLTLMVATTERIILLPVSGKGQADAIRYEDLNECSCLSAPTHATLFIVTKYEKLTLSSWRKKYAKLMAHIVAHHKKQYRQSVDHSYRKFIVPQRIMNVAVKSV